MTLDSLFEAGAEAKWEFDWDWKRDDLIRMIDQAQAEGLLTIKMKNDLRKYTALAVQSLEKARDIVADELKTRDLAYKALQNVNKNETSIEKTIDKTKLGIPTLW